MFSYYSTAEKIHNKSSDIAILPIGSTEQHGSHLPISTDSIIAEAIAKRIAEKINAFLLPTLPISTCREHMGKKGSVWINPDTFYHVIQDILLCLKEQGFKKIIVLLAHGGIFIAAPAIREINALNPDIKVIKLDIVQFMSSKEMKNILECHENLHAGEFETSLILYLNEELVIKDEIEDFIPNVPRDYLNYASILKYSKKGVWGKPSLATKEKGHEILKLLVKQGIEYIKKVFDYFDY